MCPYGATPSIVKKPKLPSTLLHPSAVSLLACPTACRGLDENTVRAEERRKALHMLEAQVSTAGCCSALAWCGCAVLLSTTVPTAEPGLFLSRRNEVVRRVSLRSAIVLPQGWSVHPLAFGDQTLVMLRASPSVAW